MRALARALRVIAADRVRENEPMARHTTFHVGGPADLLFFPANVRELQLALSTAREENVPVQLIGKGSNLLVRDGGLRGLTLAMGEPYARVRVEGKTLVAEAGAPLARVATVAQEAGLSGLEFASGIPGTLGGGCAMNAGAYGGQLSAVLESADLLENGEVRNFTRAELEMGYRTTRVLREGSIVLQAHFVLREDDPERIAARMRELNARRREKQPLNLPSAGSTFKRPKSHFAGALIEGCGLKGARIGDAQVSEKHAGFIVNLGQATAADIEALIHHVQDVVLRETGVQLEPEVRIVGDALPEDEGA